jgi:hypothetical protein
LIKRRKFTYKKKQPDSETNLFVCEFIPNNSRCCACPAGFTCIWQQTKTIGQFAKPAGSPVAAGLLQQ